MRTLHLDASRGFSAAGLLAALVDLGAAPSPVLHAVGGLGLPLEMRITTCADGSTVHLLPAGGVLLRPRQVTTVLERGDLPLEAARLASDVLGRLLVAEAAARRDPDAPALLEHEVDAGALVCVAGAAVALLALEVAEFRVSRIGVPQEPSAPLVELLGDEAGALDFGAGETTTEGAALLRALVPEGSFGVAEPAWRGVVSRGRSCGDAPVGVALGLTG